MAEDWMGEGCAGLPDSGPGTAPAPTVALGFPIKSAKMPTTMTTPSIPIQKRVVIIFHHPLVPAFGGRLLVPRRRSKACPHRSARPLPVRIFAAGLGISLRIRELLRYGTPGVGRARESAMQEVRWTARPDFARCQTGSVRHRRWPTVFPVAATRLRRGTLHI
jgi:hypothetical protein